LKNGLGSLVNYDSTNFQLERNKENCTCSKWAAPPWSAELLPFHSPLQQGFIWELRAGSRQPHLLISLRSGLN